SFRHSSNYNQQSISLAYKTLISNPPAPCPLPPAQTKQGISQNRIAPTADALLFDAGAGISDEP
ncbi:MAG: hypothetical protein RM022_012815, partial [Nostoc sp. EfeVER01]|uniref:hypothetical protein n=1 Tax=Nostoc sp. EfeVER01 TaxID=3075406 RepID=UPI002AD3E176